jgi:hypothetical protein
MGVGKHSLLDGISRMVIFENMRQLAQTIVEVYRGFRFVTCRLLKEVRHPEFAIDVISAVTEQEDIANKIGNQSCTVSKEAGRRHRLRLRANKDLIYGSSVAASRHMRLGCRHATSEMIICCWYSNCGCRPYPNGLLV